ncbi:hypothetical protein B0H16DRAFT_1893042 [Mycena metata]|uniref:Uncharacterized protein n=1 Tax=Mycena metata TaxID=1033252 RepID=A0AAD7I119_9AGAR|nr:hypothetical protein B0H16DRAFT_1893042 [Mycena metata]
MSVKWQPLDALQSDPLRRQHLSCYSLLAQVFSLLTYFHTLKNARILLVANTPELALGTLAAAFALFVRLIGYPGILLNNRPSSRCYITYKRRTLNLEAKVNQQWSQELGAAGRLTIQSVLGCRGYFSPFVEATVSATCYFRSILPECKQQFLDFQEKALTRWYIVSFGLVPVHIAIMAAGLLCSNHVTYRFDKGMMPKAYRPSREAMAVIMEQYARRGVLALRPRSRPPSSPFFPSLFYLVRPLPPAFPRPTLRFEGRRVRCFNLTDASTASVLVVARTVFLPNEAQWSGVLFGVADQYGADAAAHMIANNSGNTGPRAQTHTRGSGLSGLGSGSGGGGGSGGYTQMPPNPFSPNPSPAASASDLNLAGPQPHQDEDEEGDGYSYGCIFFLWTYDSGDVTLLTYFHTLKNARILLVAYTPELALSTLAAAFALFVSLIGYPGILLNNRPFLSVYTFLLWIAFGLLVVPGYITYKRHTLEAEVNQQWSQELGATGRLTIQSVLGCCGYFSPFVEATEKALTRWYIISFGLVPVHIAIMAAGLLCSNHITYRFGKGMMPKAYRLSREAMAVIMEQYASQLADQYGADAAAHMIANNSGNTGPRAQTHTRGTGSGLSGLGMRSGGRGYAQMPPNPFSPNPTPAASASDLNPAGPRPHEDGDEEGDGYSYGYGGVEEGDERGAGGQHAKYESLDIGAGRGF